MQTKKLLLMSTIFCGMAATAQNKGVGTAARCNAKLYLTGNYFQQDAVPVRAAVEYKLRSRQSIQLGVAPVFDNYTGMDKRGIAVTAEYRFYVYKNNPGISGSYVGPVVGALFQKSGNNDIIFENTRRTNGISWGMLLGHQWVWKKGFSVDLNATAAVYSSRTTVTYSTGRPLSYSDNAFQLGYNIGIGYAFGSGARKKNDVKKE